MKRTLVTAVTFFAVTVARASDLATTFHFNPSLSREANPVVALFGGDAKTLLLTNIFGVVVLLFVPLLIYWRARPKSFNAKPGNVWDFASLLLYNRIMPRGQFLRTFLLGIRLPKDRIQAVRLWGFAASWMVVFGSFLAAFSWWAINEWHWTGYQTVRSFIAPGKYPVIEFLPCVPIFYLAAMIFFRTEYTDYRNRTRTELRDGLGGGVSP